VSRERKPLTARSVLASTLLGLDPPVLAVGRLVETAGLFGISENTARTALSRMAAAGEVVAEDGRYRLSGRLLARQRRQDEGRRPRRRRWNGRWRLALITGPEIGARSAADRADLRAGLTRLRLAEWREGVWLRPDNLVLDVDGLAASHCSWAVADLEGEAPSLWDVDGWARDARELLAELRSLPDDTDALAPGFVLSAAVLRHLASDPLLPDDLLPARWPGGELRATYDEWDRAYRGLLAEWHRSRSGR
jgi:phenylacetic acid degradation operon negative regulatory protein